MAPRIIFVSVFWTSLGLATYAYAIYPVLVWIASRLVRGEVRPDPCAPQQMPSVAVLIAAHNEEVVIERRINNALSLDYAPGKLQVVIASDGSQDRTVEISKRYETRGVRVLDYPVREGKTAVLRKTVASLSSDIIILSDANTDFDSQAARRLVSWFVDPNVGVVCGRLVLTGGGRGRNSDGLYWSYETFLKLCEARLGALLGSNGAIYAIRRAIFPDIPPNTLVDDFVIPLAAKLETGCRIMYDKDAIALEEVAPEVNDEFRRRVRIGAGGYQAIVLLWRLLNPARGWVAFSFSSHKVLRWLCPFFLVAAQFASMALARELFYLTTSVLMVVVLGVSIPLARLPGQGIFMRFVRLAAMFTLMNAALLGGFFRWLRGARSGTWARTDRGVAGTPRVA